jgi:serine/threonine protein kinase
MVDILSGLEHLHTQCKILHNDLKDDNIALSKTLSQIRAVIGKACKISEGKYYSLTQEERKRYKTRHPQIAPDLCDGRSRQSVTTDVYSVGRVLSTINVNSSFNNDRVKEVSEQQMQYNGRLRPDIITLKNTVTVTMYHYSSS